MPNMLYFRNLRDARYSLTGWEKEFSAALDELGRQDLPGSYVGVNLDVPIANWETAER